MERNLKSEGNARFRGRAHRFRLIETAIEHHGQKSPFVETEPGEGLRQCRLTVEIWQSKSRGLAGPFSDMRFVHWYD